MTHREYDVIIIGAGVVGSLIARTLARYEVVDLIGGREDAEEGFLRYYGDDIV